MRPHPRSSRDEPIHWHWPRPRPRSIKYVEGGRKRGRDTTEWRERMEEECLSSLTMAALLPYHQQQGQKSITIVGQKMKCDTSCLALPRFQCQAGGQFHGKMPSGSTRATLASPSRRPPPHLPFRHGFITSHPRPHSHHHRLCKYRTSTEDGEGLPK